MILITVITALGKVGTLTVWPTQISFGSVFMRNVKPRFWPSLIFA